MPQLLSDQPDQNDFFGAHTGIAETLCELVLSDAEGRCVAIEGAWGSGKSTVIGLLTRKLSDQADIFIFDTWSNQGDPLRFSFMNEFASWVQQKYSALRIQAKKWLKEIDDNARNASHEMPASQNDEPREARWLVAALLVGLPVGLALASDQWTYALGIQFGRIVYFVAFFLVIAPLVYSLYLRFTSGFDFFKSIVDAIRNAADSTKRLIIRRGPLATSLEFNHKVHTICCALHKLAPQKKFVIIFDNIDRVAESNSAKVWSLLTALLEVVHKKSEAYAKNIWVLVPVDLDSIPVPVAVSRDLSDGDGTTMSAETARGSSPLPHSLKQQFIEKTFQVSMIVPLPISVATERYFKLQYQSAFFGTSVEDDWYECYAVLRELRGSTGSFTPRAIKRFINDLAALYRSRKNMGPGETPTIPLMALYLCRRHDIRHPDDILKEGFIPLPASWYLREKTPIAALAALAFGAKQKTGLLLLVKARVGRVTEAGESSEFGEIVSADGFEEAFAGYVIEQAPTWFDNDTASLGKVYAVMKTFDSKSAESIASRLGGVTKNLVSVKEISGIIDSRVASGMAYAAYLDSANQGKIQSLLQMILFHAVTNPPATRGQAAVLWFEIADVYLQELATRSVPLSGVTINFPDQADITRELLEADATRLRKYGDISIRISDTVLEEISATIIAAAKDFTLDGASLAVVKTLRKLVTDYDSASACAAMAAKIQNAGALDAKSLCAAFELIDSTLRYRSDDDFQGVVVKWMQMGCLHHHYYVTQGDKRPLTPRLAGLMAAIWPVVGQVRPWNQSNQGMSSLQQACNAMSDDDLGEAFDYLVNAGRFIDVVRSAPTYNCRQFVDSLLRVMVATNRGQFSAASYCEVILPVFDAFSEDTRQALVTYEIQELRLDEYLAQEELPHDEVGLRTILRLASAIGEADRRDALYRWVGRLLCGQKADWWQGIVERSDETLLSLVRILNEGLGAKWLTGFARGPISDIVVSEEFLKNKARSEYALVLLGAFAQEERGAIIRRVLQKALASDDVMTEFERLEKLAEFAFGDEEVLSKVSGIVTNVFIPVIDRDSKNRSRVRTLVDSFHLLEHLGPKERDDFLRILDVSESESAG